MREVERGRERARGRLRARGVDSVCVCSRHTHTHTHAHTLSLFTNAQEVLQGATLTAGPGTKVPRLKCMHSVISETPVSANTCSSCVSVTYLGSPPKASCTQTDRQTDRQTHTPTHRHTHRHAYTHVQLNAGGVVGEPAERNDPRHAAGGDACHQRSQRRDPLHRV